MRNPFKKKSEGLKVAEELEASGIQFVPLVIMNDEDYEMLKVEAIHRMKVIEKYYKEQYEASCSSIQA